MCRNLSTRLCNDTLLSRSPPKSLNFATRMRSFKRNTGWTIPLLSNELAKMKNLSKPSKTISARHGKPIYSIGSFAIRGRRLDEKTSRYFAEIIELAQTVFENITYEIDTAPDRSILRINADYGKYQILVTELFSDGIRKYRYYVMRGDWVEAGFDNASDPRAIRLKYGKIGETGSTSPKALRGITLVKNEVHWQTRATTKSRELFCSNMDCPARGQVGKGNIHTYS